MNGPGEVEILLPCSLTVWADSCVFTYETNGGSNKRARTQTKNGKKAGIRMYEELWNCPFSFNFLYQGIPHFVEYF